MSSINALTPDILSQFCAAVNGLQIAPPAPTLSSAAKMGA